MKKSLLNRSTFQKNRRNKAFTLVELLLVMLILVTLAGIVLPRMVGRGEQAKKDAAKTQIGSFKTALEMFEADNGAFPASLDDLVNQPGNATNWRGPYLEKIPVDPWNNQYQYVFPGKRNPNGFDITSPGPDGKLGTDDDITN